MAEISFIYDCTHPPGKVPKVENIVQTKFQISIRVSVLAEISFIAKLSPSSNSAGLRLALFLVSQTPPPPPASQEDDLTGRKHHRKKNLTGRQHHRTTTSHEDNLKGDNFTGRRPHWKTTSLDDNLTGRQPHGKTTSLEDNLRGR